MFEQNKFAVLSDFAESEKSLCIKHRDSFLKNNFFTIEICVGGFNLVIFMSFNKKKLTRLDKKLKYRFCIFLTHT